MKYPIRSERINIISMASSSSSSSFSQSWKHDVFISFRGTDTRNTFVDHLYSTLVQQGIYTYKDDQTLPRGETIGPSLFKAIEASQIAVIVFSENYADSSWCLQELAHIMKCKDERGLIVIPIFYRIDPSEVRNQRRKYGQAFAQHELENENVESWRKALVNAGNLSGYVANGPETIFIKQIVDSISNRLCVPISSDNEDLIGIKARLQDLKSKMEMESDGVVMVGMWGFGGCGKTTLASALYDEISTKFDGSCFLKDVREESSKHGLPKLQKDILSLVLKLKREEVVGEVGSLIKSRFRRKKVLMVLDDVDHTDQLKELAGSNAWFGKGSRIIITRRDNHLLNDCKINVVYIISLLNDDEAMQLFHKHAPRDHRPIEDYEMLSKDVVSYAGGLPLALKVLGSFLCDKDTSEWKSALARLKEIPDSDIVEKLKISYDGLKPMEKELFLDIACFFRGCNKDSAMVILDACGFHPIIGVKVLIQKALIIVSQDGWIDMHDMIQEMGHYIVRGKNPKNPELHSRIWQWEDFVRICGVHATKENNRIQALRAWYKWDQKVPPSFHQVLGNMKKLRWISWSYHPETSFPREFQPMELCYLKLEYALAEQLWEGYKHLPNLKVLDLRYSSHFVSTPDVDGLPCLERLLLTGCMGLKDIHPSIGYHERLIFIDMSSCTSVEIFPPIIRMKKLETLLLSHCYKLCKFPEIQTSMDNLIELNLRETRIKIVASSIGEYCTNLVSLDLRKCLHLQSIEGNLGLLKHLKGLHLNGCDRLENIPTEGLFNVECCLQLLSLSSTLFKKNLHRGMVSMKPFGFSTSLRRLSLARCKLVDGDIFSVFWEDLSNLQALDLSHNDFSRLHSSLSQLPRLKFLNLTHCEKLVELPDLPSSIAILHANWCYSLIIGDFPTNFKWLWKVTLLPSSYFTGKKLMHSMLQGNAIEDYFISIIFNEYIPMEGWKSETFMLQLPWNWYNEFCGFLVHIDSWFPNWDNVITIKDVINRASVVDVLDVSDEIDDRERERERKRSCNMFYISFGSLRGTSWWKSTHTTISFSLHFAVHLKVKLVPSRSQGGDTTIERVKDTTNSSKYWDEEVKGRKTFEIIHDSKSDIEIQWHHQFVSDIVDGI